MQGSRPCLSTSRRPHERDRWIGGCRQELQDRILLWNQAHLRQILRQYEIHHSRHRLHPIPERLPLWPNAKGGWPGLGLFE
jgi:hypothetical protein